MQRSIVLLAAAACFLGRALVAQTSDADLLQLFFLPTGPDEKYVQQPYGTVSQDINIDDSHTYENGNVITVNIRLDRQWVRRQNDAFPVISYRAYGTRVENRVELDDHGNTCHHTITVNFKGENDNVPFGDLPNVTVSKINHIARADLAWFDLDVVVHYEIQEEGCHAQAPGAGDAHIVLADQDDGSRPWDARFGPISFELEPYVVMRLPLWSDQFTAYGSAALAAERDATTFLGGMVETGWNGNESNGHFDTQLIDGLTVPWWNKLNPNPPGEEEANWHATMGVSWILLGQAQCGGEPSGAQWKGRFPSSNQISDLNADDGFQDNVKAFLKALHAAGVAPSVANTLRDKRDGYLMHHAWEIAINGEDPQDADMDLFPGVGVCWEHFDDDGNYDEDASVKAAKDMVKAWHLAFRPAWPDSRHFTGDAIDMTMWWRGDLKVADPNGNTVAVNGDPRTAGAKVDQAGNDIPSGDPRRIGNRAMHAVGALYQVNKLVVDPPHWSVDGN